MAALGEAKVVYKGKMQVYRFNDVTLNINLTSISSIKLSSTGNNDIFEIIFVVNNVSSFEEAVEKTKNYPIMIFDRLSYLYSLSVVAENGFDGVFWPIAGVDNNISQYSDLNLYLEFHSESYISIAENSPNIDSVLNDLVTASGNKNQLYKQFSSIMRINDPCSQYMFLYSILLQVFGDRQADVDNNILQIASNNNINCSQTSSPYNNKEETTYTRLRNEVAHIRPGASLGNTYQEMSNNLENLRTIVKKVIEQQS